MKKLFLFAFWLMCNSFNAQSQDLAKLATGEYLSFNAIFDESNNLYGYLSVYGYGKTGEKTKKFEYIILDKNLNPVANKEFEGDITAQSYFGYIDFKKNLILIPTFDDEDEKDKNFFYPHAMEVSLNSNTITPKIYYKYDHGNFIEDNGRQNIREIRNENKLERRDNGFNYISYVYEIKEGGFLVLELNDYGKYTSNENLMRYDKDKNVLWSYKYNTSGDKNNIESIKILNKDEKNIYILQKKFEKKGRFQGTTFNLLVLDINTGEKVSSEKITAFSVKTLDQISHLYSNNKFIDNSKVFDDKIVMVGYCYPYIDSYNGFARMTIDKSDFYIGARFTLFEFDFSKFLPKVSFSGGVEDGYFLIPRDLFFMKDGSVGILMEKMKPASQTTSDLVYAFTDEDFNLKEVKVFKKEITKGAMESDYLFSQYLNDGKDVVFFYRDYQKDDETKEKNWNLFINTLIDGQFKQEMVPISAKDDYYVTPYVGKEGYILLREYNEKEKFNKIRLERLNY